jgi:hypothetical protein
MLALVKLLWVTLLLFLPGGLIFLCGYFLGRAVWHSWQREQDSVGAAKLRKVMAAIRHPVPRRAPRGPRDSLSPRVGRPRCLPRASIG